MKRTRIALDIARRLLTERDRKPLRQILREYRAYRRAKGGARGEYFTFFLYRSHVERPTDHLSTGERERLGNYFDTMDEGRVLRDKLVFQRTLADVEGIQLPVLLGYTEGAATGRPAFVGADGVTCPLDGPGSLADAVREMLAVAGPLGVFAKERTGGRGEGAYRLSALSGGGAPASAVEALWRSVQWGDYLFQGCIAQHPELSALAPDTVNTLRITTLCLPGAEPEFASVWLKVGRRGAVVDNGPGMLVVGVDGASGRLHRVAWTKYKDGGGSFERHPETGVPFGAVVVPHFDEAVRTALVAATHIRRPPVVGWDVAISTTGPVLLEGNTGSNYKSDELAHGKGFLAHPILGPTLREVLTATSRS